jgi:hypothetical protein
VTAIVDADLEDAWVAQGGIRWGSQIAAPGSVEFEESRCFGGEKMEEERHSLRLFIAEIHSQNGLNAGFES